MQAKDSTKRRVFVQRGRFNFANPSEESVVVYFSGFGLFGEVDKEFERGSFSLFIPESHEGEVESARTAEERMFLALEAQNGWLYSRDKKPALAVLDRLNSDEDFYARTMIPLLLGEAASEEKKMNAAKERCDSLKARAARLIPLVKDGSEVAS